MLMQTLSLLYMEENLLTVWWIDWISNAQEKGVCGGGQGGTRGGEGMMGVLI